MDIELPAASRPDFPGADGASYPDTSHGPGLVRATRSALGQPDPNALSAHADLPVKGWPRAIALWAGVLVALGLVFASDVAHLASRWYISHTYGHCLLIPPILAWLVYQRRAGLARIAPKPWLPGAALMLGAGVVWLVGHLADVALVRHTALILLFQLSVPTVFGLAVARAVLFPLFFALFMIPTGEQLEPALQTITAKFAMQLLALFNVPAFNDGVFITIPNGDFEVAEACSGVRFLIAMVAFGALVANVCFKSWTRRIVFMTAAIVLPIVANGIRAWGTIYIAHLTTPQFARGVDHIIYGWIFFAIVMALLLAVGWRFFDRPVDDPFIDPAALQDLSTPPAPPSRLLIAAAAAFVAGAAAPAWAMFADARTVAHPTRALVLAAPPGWTRVPHRGVPWRPIYKGASADVYETFVDAAGQSVDVYVAVFDRQSPGHELVGYGQGALELVEEGGWQWAANAPDPAGGHGYQINKAGAARDIVQFYRVNDRMTGSQYTAKVEGLKSRLLGGDPQAATLFVSAERVDPLVSARPALDRFLRAAGPPSAIIDGTIERGR